MAETTGDSHSYGFRRARSTADAIEQVRNALGRQHSPKWVLEADIKGCFDNISHDWLLAHIPTDRGVLRKWLKAGYFENGVLFPTPGGTPQGGIISPVLANMALDGLQAALTKLFRTVREARSAKVNFIRYADDFIITGSSRELLEDRIKPLVRDFLRERGLELSDTKTLVTPVTDGFDFLGWNVRWRSGILLTKPSKKNLGNFLAKVRGTLKEMRTSRQADVIDKLNPVLRGWAGYHRSQMATRTFAKADHAIWTALRRWACRRHPNKGVRWTKARYFRVIEGRDWRFAEKDKTLLTLSSFTKKPHIKIDGSRNPYSPEDEDYFDARLTRRMQTELKWRRKASWLWHWQEGLCPKCQQKITPETGWESHHIIERSLGGSDKVSNLALLHPNCHRQHHANKKTNKKKK